MTDSPVGQAGIATLARPRGGIQASPNRHARLARGRTEIAPAASVFGLPGAAPTDRGRGRPGITSRTQAAPTAARDIPQEHSLATSNAGRHSTRIVAREDGRAHRQDADHQGQRYDLRYQRVPQSSSPNRCYNVRCSSRLKLESWLAALWLDWSKRTTSRLGSLSVIR